MEIDLDLTARQAIFRLEDRIIFHAKKLWINWRYTWYIYNFEDKLIAYSRAKKYFMFLNFDYLVTIRKIQTEVLLTFKSGKGIYKVEVTGNLHELIKHKGHKTSYFINSQQVGYCDRNTFSLGHMNRIKIILDDNLDLDIIVPIICASICENEYSETSDININLGNIGPELLKFDKNWIPKLN